MRVLAVFIFMCLLFQTTILAQLASSETQHQISSSPQEQNQDTNLNQKLDQKTVSDSGKTVSKLTEETESNLDEKTESNLNEKTESNLNEKTESNLNETIEANLDEKTKSNLDEKTKSNLNEKTESNLDETTEASLNEKTESSLNETIEANLDEKTKSNLNEKTESNLDETTEANLDENTEIKLKKKNKSKLEGKTKSKLEGKKESKTDSKTNDDFLDSAQCLQQNYTRLSCSKVFCPPWRRCIEGQCVCKMPYKCLRQDLQACTLEGSKYYSMCQIKAISCRSNTATFSHFGTECKVEDKVFVEVQDSQNVTMINTAMGKNFVCGRGWNMAAANVVCRNPLNFIRGALKATKVKYSDLKNSPDWPKSCMKVQCTGSELSLAECTIYNNETVTEDTDLATATCYDEPPENCKSFLCANGKCLQHSGRSCNGVDDCGDNSDEMCCRKCTRTAFHCESGVCIPKHAVRDGIRDCLGGEDELPGNPNPEEIDPKKLFSNPMLEIKTIRSSTESQLQCGIPNMEYEHKLEDDAPSHSRRKRLVGGEEALPTQIQWQVAIQDEGSIHCGGAYLGGCWVLTAAHCVRPKPKSYRIKISLWKKHRKQSTTDSIPVKNIIIHHEYNPQTYANDIALVQLEELSLSNKCMQDNPAVRAVCVPWSTQQFLPNSTCTISGWGRDREGMSSSILKWANVTIIGDCKNYYKDRFLPGMECAGDLDGKVDSCQGDSGGPLVCKDASGVSYVWGIVSWGDKCGQPNNPGVYTKVAHYFDWIRFHTGWPAVTKYNQ